MSLHQVCKTLGSQKWQINTFKVTAGQKETTGSTVAVMQLAMYVRPGGTLQCVFWAGSYCNNLGGSFVWQQWIGCFSTNAGTKQLGGLQIMLHANDKIWF